MPSFEDYDLDEKAVVTDGDVHCERVSPSGKALLINFGDGEEEWIPVSQIHDDSEVYKEGHDGKLVISRWLAEQEGWV